MGGQRGQNRRRIGPPLRTKLLKEEFSFPEGPRHSTNTCLYDKREEEKSCREIQDTRLVVSKFI